MATFKDGEGLQVSFAVTFTDGKPIMVVYTISKVIELIGRGNVRAITEKLNRWSGNHDDGTRGFEILANIGPMSPKAWMARMQAGGTLESVIEA